MTKPQGNQTTSQSAGATHGIRLAILLVALLIAVNIGLLSRDLQVGTYMDDGYYIALAMSLASGHGYSDISDPLMPPHNRFAPGYPMILAPVALIAGNAFWPLQAFNALLAIVMLALCWKYFSDALTSGQALAVLAMTGCNTLAASQATMVMSESSFLILVLLALLAYRRLAAKDGRGQLRFELGLAAAATAAYFVRTVGLSLVGAVLAHSAFARAWRRTLVVLAVFGLLAGLWAIRSTVVSHTYVSLVYQEIFSETRTLDIPRNIADYAVRLVPGAMIPLVEHPKVQHLASVVHLDWLRKACMLAVTLVVIAGWVRAAYDPRRRLEAVFVALYCVLLLPWPEYNKGMRYVYPMLPFFYSYVIDIYCICACRRWPACAKVGVALVAATVCLFSLYNFSLFRNPTRTRVRDISIGATWIRDNSPRDTVVMASHPMSLWLYTRRPTIPIVEPSRIDEVARERNVTYVLIGPGFAKPDEEPRIPPVLEDTTRYRLAFADRARHTYVFRRLSR